MTSPCWKSLLAVLSLCLSGCGDATGPEAALPPCTDDTGTVEVDVSGGQDPVFSWSPACAVAYLLVEEDASDMWVIGTIGDISEPSPTDNRIAPPITYGVAPTGSQRIQEPLHLVSGQTYEVVLWRVVPESSAAACQERYDNLCLMAVHSFTR